MSGSRDTPSAIRKLAWGVLFALPVVYGVVGFLVPPAVGADASWGLWTWQSHLRGAPWNCYWNVNPQDIAADTPTFLACFTPGQYLVPVLLATLGLSLPQAVMVTTLACTIAGLLGVKALFRHFGLPDRASLLACGAMAGAYWITSPFNTYPGGEVLLFGVLPWVALWTLRLAGSPSAKLLLLPLLFLLAAFMKLSAAPILLSLIAGLLLLSFRRRSHHRLRALLASAALQLSFFAVFYGLLWWLHTSRGWTAALERLSFTHATEKALFALGAPLGSALSGFQILNRLIFHPEGLQSALGSPRALVCLALVALAAVPVIVAVIRSQWKNVAYSSIALGVTAAMAAMMFLLTQGEVYLEERHFRFAGILLLPGTIELALAAKSRALKCATALVLIVAIGFGLSSWVAKVRRNHAAPKVAGFTFLEADREVVAAIEALDASLNTGNNLFFFPTPEWLPIVRHNRAAAPHNDSIERTFFTQAQRFRGTVDNLILILPAAMALDERAARVASGFPGMSGWRHCQVGAYAFLHAGRSTLGDWSHSGDLAERRPWPALSDAPVAPRGH